MNVYLSKKNLIYVGFGVIAFFVISVLLLLVLFNPYPLKYKSEIISASEKYNVPASLIASIIYAESCFDKNAKSESGAVGLMQILPSTAEWVCSQINLPFSNSTLYQPQENIEIGTFYVKYLLNKFQDVNTSLASYNAGEGNVMLWLMNPKYSDDKVHIKTTPFKQTNAYVDKINSVLEIYEKKLS